MSSQPLFGSTTASATSTGNASPWHTSSDNNNNNNNNNNSDVGGNKRSEPSPVETPTVIGTGVGATTDSAVKFNGNAMRFTTPHGMSSSSPFMNNGGGSIGGGDGGGSGLPKQSISFPRQNLNSTSFTAQSFGVGGMGGMGDPASSSSSPFGPNQFSFTKTPSTFQPSSSSATSSTPTSFQPNSFLSRSSPSTSLSSPMMTSNSFIKPYDSHSATSSSTTTGAVVANDDLASSIGLRRRMKASSSSATNIHNHNSNATTTMKRPPLPNMTRLGVSADTFDDFKENIHNGSFMKPSSSSAAAATPTSVLKRSSGHGSSEKRPPQSTSSVSWNINSAQNTNNTSATNTQTSTATTTATATNNGTVITTTMTQPINYRTWVLLYGFTNNLEFDTIFANFENFGIVTERFPSSYSNGSSEHGIRSGSNWVCLKYESTLEAEKALCQNQSLIHIRGQNSVIRTNPTATSNSSASNGEMSSSFQDDIVAIGVMRIDENIAMKLGLTNYLVNGNTGFQRLNQSRSQSHKMNGDKNEDQQMRFAKSITSENDILLLGNEKLRHSSADGQGLLDYDDDDRDGGVCEQFLAWFFQW